MSIEEIEKRINGIREMLGDSESCHSAEDELRLDFIEYVAAFPGDICLSEKARLVASTKHLEFERWCA